MLFRSTIETSELYRRLNENLHDATIWWGDGGIAPIIQPDFYVPLSFEPMGPGRVPYAVPWATWCVNPRHPLAEEPPPAVLRQIVTYRQLLSEPDPAKQVALMRRVLDQAAEQFYVFGICLEQNRHAVLGRGFRNVPEPLLDAWTYPDPAPVNPCQFYLDVSVSKTAP